MKILSNVTDKLGGSLSSSVSVNFVIDGNGSPITTGSKGFVVMPFGMTVNGWTITADQSGSIVVDVKKSSYSSFPSTSSIASTDKPTLSSAQKNQNLTLTVWTTSVSSGDILEFVVNSILTVTRVTVSIQGLVS